MSPKEALENMTYTSEREWEGTIYTISDIRFPEYNGKKIMGELKNGKYILTWVN
jgi:hypothetical protein